MGNSPRRPTPQASNLDRDYRHSAVTQKPALAYLVEWKANQKGRRALVFRLSSAPARVCAEKGVPVRLSPDTKTRLFPVDVANEFMMKVGASWVEDHNARSWAVAACARPRRGKRARAARSACRLDQRRIRDRPEAGAHFARPELKVHPGLSQRAVSALGR